MAITTKKRSGPTVNVATQNRMPMGFQGITDLSAATSLTVPAVDNKSAATMALIQCELNGVRWRDDGTAPTDAIGMLLLPGTMLEYTGNLAAIQFIEEDLPDAKMVIDTNFDIKTGEKIEYDADEITVALAAATSCDTGTAKTIASNQWAAMLVTGDSGGALTGTWTADAATEAAAIVLLKATAIPSGETPIAYITVKTAVGAAWIAGTSALETGTGGNVSSDTNYYNYRATKLNVSYYE